MKKILIAIIAALALTGCATSADSATDFGTKEINFAQMMIPHHQQAIEISEIALTNSSNPQVIAIANQIMGAQEPEIAMMMGWDGVEPSMHMGHMMDGMLSDDEISELRKSLGSEFDRLFLEGMIKHHRGAIDMANGLLDSKNVEVAALCKEIIQAQQREIAEMEALLNL